VDLRLFARVLWRFKFVVGAGFVVAVFLSVLTVSKIDLSHGAPKLSPRIPPLYASNATLLITQQGFPWGSAVQQFSPAQDNGGSPAMTGDLGRLTALANLYVQIANTDTIKSVVRHTGPRGASISATQTYSFSPGFNSTPLPMITLTGTGRTRADARVASQLGVDALTGYLKNEQAAGNIAKSKRVVVQEIQPPTKVFPLKTTKKTLPIVVFLTVMLAVTGLAFVLENLRPRLPEPEVSETTAEPLISAARRSA